MVLHVILGCQFQTPLGYEPNREASSGNRPGCRFRHLNGSHS